MPSPRKSSVIIVSLSFLLAVQLLVLGLRQRSRRGALPHDIWSRATNVLRYLPG